MSRDVSVWKALSLTLLVASAGAFAGCDGDDAPPDTPDGGSRADAGPDGGAACTRCEDPETCGAPARTEACAGADAGRFCSGDCWCWEKPLPHGNPVTDAYFRATNDGWAVGEQGLIQHWDGTRWTRVPSGTSSDLAGVHAVSATDIWAVGKGGTVLRSSGGAFSAVGSGTGQDLRSVWASGPADVWMVGANGTALRHQGSGFQSVSTGTTQRLNDVWGSGPNDVWMVGEGGTVRRHDGTSVASIPTNTDLPLYEVTGTGPNDVWSVTSDDPCLTCNDYGIVYRVSTSGLEERFRNSDQFFNVFAASPSMVLVTGEGPRYRWDGAAWTRLSTSGSGVMAGASPDDVWLFGHGGRIDRWNGSAWTRTDPEPLGTVLDLHGSGPGAAWAIAGVGKVLRQEGGGWSIIDLSSRFPFSGDLRSVYAASPSAVWVAANRFDGYLLRWNGTGFADEYVSEDLDLMAVHGASETDVWAVGEAGEAVHRDGTGWTRMPTGVTATLRGVWVHGPSLAVAVGSSGTIVAWNGSAWSPMTSGTTEHLTGVWGTGPADIWAVGEDGTVVHFNGTAWSAACSGTVANLTSVWGTSATQVWATGDRGTLLRYDGTQWRPERTGTRNALHGLWGPSASELWLGGESALLLKR